MLDEVILHKKRNKLSDLSGIYGIINIVNNKIYIGSTVNFRKRKNSHISALRQGRHWNQHLQRSFLKHGESKFVFFEIETCEKKYLEEKEQKYIDNLFSSNRSFGYNIRHIVSLNGTCSPETRFKISKSKREYFKNNIKTHCGICGTKKEFSKCGAKFCRACKKINIKRHRDKKRIKEGRLSKETHCMNGHDRSVFGYVIKKDKDGRDFRRCNECHRLALVKLAEKHRNTYIPTKRTLKKKCRHGHEFSKENTVLNKRGERVCLTCKASKRKIFKKDGFCLNGHLLSDENIYFNNKKQKRCKVCKSISSKKYRDRIKG